MTTTRNKLIEDLHEKVLPYISNTGFTILSLLILKSDEDFKCDMSNKELSHYLSLSAESFRSDIKILISFGLVNKAQNSKGRFKNNAYQINPDAISNFKTGEHLFGFVYFFKRLSDGFTKIGFSKSPNGRRTTLKAKHGRLETILITQGDKALENDLHAKYDRFRRDGEWFNLSQAHLEEIKTNYKAI